MFIIEKLREDNKLLPEELVSEVDGGVDDSRAMCSNGVSDMSDTDGVQMLVVAGLFHKHLQIIKYISILYMLV